MNCPEVGQKENEENVFEKHRQIFEEELIPNYWGREVCGTRAYPC